MGTKWNGINRNKRPRLVTPKTKARNGRWKEICLERAKYLIQKYGFLICEYSGERINCLTTTYNDDNDGWGHHIDHNRNNGIPENCYLTKYRYHRYIEEHNIKVEQEDFQGRQ
jgi:hypothetical protein